MWDNVNRPSPAVNLCNHCPALQPCREWLAARPPNSVSGLVAGQSGDDLMFSAAGGGVLRVSHWRPRVFNPARDSLKDFPKVTPAI